MFYIWFIIVIILGILEVSTVNLVSIWFVISGILAMISSIYTDNVYIQVAIFVVVGIILMPFSKKIYSKIKKDTKIDTMYNSIDLPSEIERNGKKYYLTI